MCSHSCAGQGKWHHAAEIGPGKLMTVFEKKIVHNSDINLLKCPGEFKLKPLISIASDINDSGALQPSRAHDKRIHQH
jgi:hypothetical protein